MAKFDAFNFLAGKFNAGFESFEDFVVKAGAAVFG